MYDYFVSVVNPSVSTDEILLKGAVVLTCVVGFFICLSLYSLFFKR